MAAPMSATTTTTPASPVECSKRAAGGCNHGKGDGNEISNRNEQTPTKQAETFVIDCDANKKIESPPNLQEAFLKFRKDRQNEIRQARQMKEVQLQKARDPDKMDALRQKFLDQAKKYFGVPYAKRYWKPEDAEYNSPLFFDCCGLVRRVVRDLAEEFGFIIGSWNQSYMYDTLPISLQEEEMRAGDLVFISATYYNEKAKKQRHDLVHVEIWLGDGPKTIGARWQKGKVQVFESYDFEAKSYHSPTYHFKSIDTWLKGICRSHCPIHPWQRTTYDPSRHSVFALDTDQQVDQAAGDSDEEDTDLENVEASVLQGEKKMEEKNMLCADQRNCDSLGHSGVSLNDLSPDSDPMQGQHVGFDSLTVEEPDSAVANLNLKLSHCCMISTQTTCTCRTVRLSNTEKTTCINTVSSETKAEADISQCGDASCDGACNEYDDELIRDFTPVVDMGEKDREHPGGCDSTSSTGSGADISQQMPCDGDGERTSSSGNGDCSPGDSSGTEAQAPAVNKGEGSENSDSANQRGSRRGGDGRRGHGSRQSKLPNCSLPTNMQPTFYVGEGNGVSLVEAPLLALGWKRILDKTDENFKLRWVQCKSRISYSSFREGEQLVNHIPNCQLLTNKLGLFNSLQEYERVTMATKGRPPRLRMADFVPETFRLDEKNDRETFLNQYKDGEIWICKPTGMNQGKGIYLIRSKDEISKTLEERDQAQQQRRSIKPMMSRVIQRYIMNPLLLDERKFDIRTYMLIASTAPYLVLYHKGYVRLSCQKFSFEDTNLTTHLTNQYIQKKDPQYQDVKEDTAWSMDKMNDYINTNLAAEKGLDTDWVLNTLPKQIQKIMVHCFHAVKHKLQCKVGYFDLYGLDFMIDQDMKVWLIEINVNPSLQINCEALREVIPGVVEESIHLSLECFEKSRRNQPLLPLKSLQNMTILHSGTRYGAVPTRPSRSVSPGKETMTERSRAHPKARTPAPSSSRNYLPASSSFSKESLSLSATGTSASATSPKKSSSSSSTNSSAGPQVESTKTSSASDSVHFKLTHAEASKRSKDRVRPDRGN